MFLSVSCHTSELPSRTKINSYAFVPELTYVHIYDKVEELLRNGPYIFAPLAEGELQGEDLVLFEEMRRILAEKQREKEKKVRRPGMPAVAFSFGKIVFVFMHTFVFAAHFHS
jgi:hypothetical protein